MEVIYRIFWKCYESSRGGQLKGGMKLRNVSDDVRRINRHKQIKQSSIRVGRDLREYCILLNRKDKTQI